MLDPLFSAIRLLRGSGSLDCRCGIELAREKGEWNYGLDPAESVSTVLISFEGEYLYGLNYSPCSIILTLILTLVAPTFFGSQTLALVDSITRVVSS